MSNDYAENEIETKEIETEKEFDLPSSKVQEEQNIEEPATKTPIKKASKVRKIISIIFTTVLSVVALSVLTLYLLSVFLFDTVVISGDSMKNTLFHNEVILINTAVTPKLYDIAVISDKKEGGELIIKRIVAVSGDTVKIDSHGALLVKKAGETEFEPIYSENCLIPENYKYESSWLTHDDYDEGFLIPDGEYFFLGDNRANSNDSRYDYRTCTREEILGVAGDFLLSLKEEVTDWTIFKDKVRVFFGKDPLLK